MALTKIPNNLITADAIDGTLIADNAIDSEHYTDGSIDLAHMSANSIDSDQYVDGSIDTAHIAADQITSALIADNAVGSEHIQDNNILTAAIANDQVTTAKINDGDITNALMAANSINSDQYVDGSIDLAHMSVNSIDSDQYVDGSIDTIHIADDAVTSAKLDTNIAIGGTLGVTGNVTVGGGSGTVTGNLTGNVSGNATTATTVVGSVQSNIASLGTLTSLTGGTGDLIWDSPTFVVDSSTDRVGIGTTTPATKLQIVGPNSAGGSGWKSELFSGYAANYTSYRVGLGYDNSGAASWGLGLMTNGDTKVWIGDNSKVGIGTSSPDANLSVTDATVNSKDVLYLKSGADSVGDYLGMAFEIGVGGNGPHGAVRVYGGPSGNDSYLSLLTTTDGGTLVQGLTQDHVGKIGIGTATPSTDLHLYHTDGDRPHLLLENFGNRGTGDAPILEFYLNDQTTGGIGDDTQVGVITFAGDEKDGGTKEIYGQIRGLAHDPGSGGSNKGTIDFMIQKDGTLTQTMALVNGKVGIGTGTPADKLHLSGGDIRIDGGNQQTHEIAWFNSSHYLAGIRQASHGSYNDSGGLQFLTSGTSNAAESVKMVIDTQGKVGIGMTPVSRKLEVNDSIRCKAGEAFEFGGNVNSIQNVNTNDIRVKLNTNERFRFAASGQLGIGGENYGTDGQLLTSGGAGAAVAWEDAPASGISIAEVIVMAG